jgi:hypothetical protein
LIRLLFSICLFLFGNVYFFILQGVDIKFNVVYLWTNLKMKYVYWLNSTKGDVVAHKAHWIPLIFIDVNVPIKRLQTKDNFISILGYDYLRCYFDCITLNKKYLSFICILFIAYLHVYYFWRVWVYTHEWKYIEDRYWFVSTKGGVLSDPDLIFC